MAELIYHLATADDWRYAVAAGSYRGGATDRADGFIHLSTAAQVAETAARYFTGRADLVLLTVDPVRLGDALRWELSRDGALFPHYYGVLDTAIVGGATPIALDASGRHQFPPEIMGAAGKPS